MKCVCGFEVALTVGATTGKKLINEHRRQCDVFWGSVRTEMHRISTHLRGTATTVSSGEWYKYRGADYPSKKLLIDWCGSWSNVLKRINMGMMQSGPGKKQLYIPTQAEFFAKITVISRDVYADEHLIASCKCYDDNRPEGWPAGRTMLKRLGYTDGPDGWRQMVSDHFVGVMATSANAMNATIRKRETEQARRVKGFDYRNPQDERMLALVTGEGLAVCKGTYEQTGRMMLR